MAIGLGVYIYKKKSLKIKKCCTTWFCDFFTIVCAIQEYWHLLELLQIWWKKHVQKKWKRKIWLDIILNYDCTKKGSISWLILSLLCGVFYLHLIPLYYFIEHDDFYALSTMWINIIKCCYAYRKHCLLCNGWIDVRGANTSIFDWGIDWVTTC